MLLSRSLRIKSWPINITLFFKALFMEKYHDKITNIALNIFLKVIKTSSTYIFVKFQGKTGYIMRIRSYANFQKLINVL